LSANVNLKRQEGWYSNPCTGLDRVTEG